MGKLLTLYHAGFAQIPSPDIRIGRKNADFGQGFYLSDDEEFSRRWAKARLDLSTWLNKYMLDTNGLRIRRFSRDEEWFDYIFANRTGKADSFSEYDVIIGPIANDTIYDTWGILTSGLIGREKALEILSSGPAYEQTVIKTEKAAAALRFLGAEILPPEKIDEYRKTVRAEEAEYQEILYSKIGNIRELFG